MKKPKLLKIDLKPVESSAIKAVGYHEESRTMRIQFQSGAVYDYAGVEPEKHGAFVGAESIGKHFSKHIRGAHEFTKHEGTL